MIIIIMAHHICRPLQEVEDEVAGEASLIPMTTTAMMTIMNTMAMTITITAVAMKIRIMVTKTFKFKVEDEGVEEPVDLLFPGVEVQLQLEEEVSPSVEAQDLAEGHVDPEEELNKEAAWYVCVRVKASQAILTNCHSLILIFLLFTIFSFKLLTHKGTLWKKWTKGLHASLFLEECLEYTELSKSVKF